MKLSKRLTSKGVKKCNIVTLKQWLPLNAEVLFIIEKQAKAFTLYKLLTRWVMGFLGLGGAIVALLSYVWMMLTIFGVR